MEYVGDYGFGNHQDVDVLDFILTIIVGHLTEGLSSQH